jgi:hypothetical protein
MEHEPILMLIDPDFFEHLLICLASQKFLHERGNSPAARRDQKLIDRAYLQGWELLRSHQGKPPRTGKPRTGQSDAAKHKQ